MRNLQYEMRICQKSHKVTKTVYVWFEFLWIRLFHKFIGPKSPNFLGQFYTKATTVHCAQETAVPHHWCLRTPLNFSREKKDRFEVLGQKTRKVGPKRAEKLLPFPYIVVRLE